MKTTLEIPVRSTEVDSMGHVNNAKYLEYLEWGREDWFKKANCSFDNLIARGIGLASVNINIDYLGECLKDDILLVVTSPVKAGKSSFVFLQEIFKKDSMKKVISTHVTLVTIGMETRKSTPIPSDLSKHLISTEI